MLEYSRPNLYIFKWLQGIDFWKCTHLRFSKVTQLPRYSFPWPHVSDALPSPTSIQKFWLCSCQTSMKLHVQLYCVLYINIPGGWPITVTFLEDTHYRDLNNLKYVIYYQFGSLFSYTFESVACFLNRPVQLDFPVIKGSTFFFKGRLLYFAWCNT